MSRRSVALIVAALATALAVAALYVARTEFLGASSPYAAAPPRAPGSAVPATTEFSFLADPRPLPDLAFTDGEGRPLTLHTFRGRPLLLNLWATWCVPCRKEMPALDRLQVAVAPSELLVLPLSIDRQGAAVVKPFYAELGLKSLGIYVDASGQAARDLHTVGVPTTLLVDGEGREIGRKLGPAEWDTPETIGLIRAHLKAHRAAGGDP